MTADLAGRRLDQALASLLPQYSRQRLQGWIEAGQVLLDGRVPRSKDKVLGGEQVRIEAQLEPQLAVAAEKAAVAVVYEDRSLRVIDKPAGLAVHAGPSRAPNLEECFDALRFGLLRSPALAHRLDADTSGVLVLGRHPKALAKLGRLFSGRGTEKTYWAVVEGAPPADQGVFDWPLLKLNTRRGWSVTVSDKGQPCLSRYKVLGRAPGMSWLELIPETGRTHQLRVHCAHAGCPIIGDRLYGTPGAGQPLHLQSHAIVLPLSRTRPAIRVEAAPPAHMQKALQACGYIPSRVPSAPCCPSSDRAAEQDGLPGDDNRPLTP
jgi:RluA family pseudouridine synthase